MSRTTTVAARGNASLLLLAFGGAVALRAGVAGAAGAASVTAGLVFAGLLVTLAAGRCAAPRLTRLSIGLGIAGAVVLLVPVVVLATSRGISPPATGTAYVSWAAATVVVATAEEMFLRGALFDALQRWRGSDAAVVGAAIAFAALHVPLYGWHVLPLDLAVGLGLGALRLASGTWAAPAIAHVGADLAGWWFV